MPSLRMRLEICAFQLKLALFFLCFLSWLRACAWGLSALKVVAGVSDLVALESQLLARTRSYEAAERALELDPDLLNNRIVLHFQYLFQVKKLEGVFPKMNELYVYCSEVQSVLRALRSVCRLPVNASPKSVLAAVQHLLVSAADAAPPPPPAAAKAPTLSADRQGARR